MHQCLVSVLQNAHPSYEVIVVDQSSGHETREIIRHMKDKRIRYRHSDQIGNTKALNEALSMARGDIYAFTDDDCIVPKKWLTKIEDVYLQHPEVSGVSGQTLPYTKTMPNDKSVCPGMYESALKPRFVLSVGPTVHSPVSGFGKGTNMSFRKEVFIKIGGFKEWLGPGAMAPGAGNETEFIYRAIKNKYILYVRPDIIVLHDRWLTEHEAAHLIAIKVQGYTAFISYSIIRHMDFRLFDGVFRFGRYFKQIIFAAYRSFFFRKPLSPAEIYAYKMSSGVIRGVCIGLFFAVRDMFSLK